MKKIFPPVFVVVLILLVGAGGISSWKQLQAYQSQQNIIRAFSPYYQGLAKGCYKKEGVDRGCCLSSVANMEAQELVLIPENGCIYGRTERTLRCKGGYTWCEQIVIPPVQ